MNPGDMFAMAGMMKQFQADHPKALAFYQNEILSGLPEGTIVEVSIQKPGCEKATSNIRITANDIANFEKLKNMRQ